MSTNEQTRKEKTSAVETLHAEIDELMASIAKGTQEIMDLTTEIANIDKAVRALGGRCLRSALGLCSSYRGFRAVPGGLLGKLWSGEWPRGIVALCA